MPADRLSEINSDLIADRALAIVDEQGAAALTMRTLATRVGISASSLYGFVRTKDDIVRLLLTHVLEPPVPVRQRSVSSQVHDLAQHLEQVCRAHPHALTLLRSHSDVLASIVGRQVATAFARGHSPRDPTAELATAAIQRLLIGSVLMPTASMETDAAVPRLSDMVELLLRGIAGEPRSVGIDPRVTRSTRAWHRVSG